MTLDEISIETRGLVLKPDLAASRSDILETIELVKGSGFNTLLLDLLPEGELILPISPYTDPLRRVSSQDEEKQQATLAAYIDAARLHKLSVFLLIDLLEHTVLEEDEFQLFHLAPNWYFPKGWPPAPAKQESKGEDTLTMNRRWLIPNHADSRRFLADYLSALLSAYPIEGLCITELNIPRVETADQIHSFKFQQYRKLARLPIPAGDEGLAQETPPYWNSYWNDQVGHLLQYIAQRLSKARPQLMLMGMGPDDDHSLSEDGSARTLPFHIILSEYPSALRPQKSNASTTSNLGLVRWEREKTDSKSLHEARDANPLGFLIYPRWEWTLLDAEAMESVLEGEALAAHTDMEGTLIQLVHRIAAQTEDQGETDLYSNLVDALNSYSATNMAQLQVFIDAWTTLSEKWEQRGTHHNSDTVRDFTKLRQIIDLWLNRQQMLHATPYYS